MKKIILSAIAIAALTINVWAQSPEAFKYQSVVRDASQNVIPNQVVGMQFTILQGSITGTVVYQETFAPTTNAYGLVNLEIGNGTVVTGTFATIDWANGPYFIETALDATGGTSYVVMGTSQLLSVPYALYAKTSGSSTPGPMGPAGTDGVDGIDGTNGIDGVDGATGPQGPAGVDGVDGVDGATGPQGATGPTGVDGIDGATGPQGPAGADGIDGTNGIDGVDGVDGATGPQGPAGPGLLPTSAGTNDVLVWNGTAWVAADLGGLAHSTLANALTSYATAGNIQFRYSQTTTGGYLEARTITGSQNTMVFASKKQSSWSPGGSSVIENYHNNASLSTTWAPVMSLWTGASWSGRVPLTTYEEFEGTMWDMGGSGNPPSPSKCWKFFAAIDGYNLVFIRAVYQGQ